MKRYNEEDTRQAIYQFRELLQLVGLEADIIAELRDKMSLTLSRQEPASVEDVLDCLADVDVMTDGLDRLEGKAIELRQLLWQLRKSQAKERLSNIDAVMLGKQLQGREDD